MKIGFIGLGSMGRPIALNLANGGHEVIAWNRSPVDAAGVAPVTMVGTTTEALQADVVFTMLADDGAIRDVLLAPGVLQSARTGIIHVVTATISPEFAEELSAMHAELGLGYVAAPVFGTPDVAAAGNLNILAAGAPQMLATVQPLFEIIGKRVFVLGDRPAHANVSKIAGNMMLTMAIEAMAEALAITGGYGVAPEAFLELMLETQFACRAYQNYGGRIQSKKFEPGFKMSLGLKDLRLAVDAAKEASASAPMLGAVRQRMGEAVDAGMGARDWSAMADFTMTRPGR
jgi:3-hydroxyisobutyrate dehydrogenase-like beta-hydroxyacid dehydrogenase